MCTVLMGITLCLGTLGYSEFIEPVAQRRMYAEWGGLSHDPKDFDVLVGTEDCNQLGQTGWLLRNDNFYSVLVVDCKQKTHVFSDGYLADINQPGCLEGYLILKPKGGQNEVVSEMDNLLSFRTQKPQ